MKRKLLKVILSAIDKFLLTIKQMLLVIKENKNNIGKP